MKIFNKNRETGASIIETMMVFPIILLLGFGVVHLGLIFQAQSNLEYAALMAARVGAATSIDIEAMTAEVRKRMEASHVGTAASLDARTILITVLNPTQQMFATCGQAPTYNSGDCVNPAACEIPNFALQSRPNTPNCDGASIQDANILRIQVDYYFDTRMPFLNRLPFTKGKFESADEDGVEITAIATVRMQSPARLTGSNNANIL